MKRDEYFFELMIIGSPSVGKTALLKQYFEMRFSSIYQAQMGDDVKIKRIEQFDKTNKSIKLQVVDCKSHENYRDPKLGANCDGVVAVYDTTDLASFENIKAKIIKIKSESTKKVILVGAKCDLEDPKRMDSSEAKKFADGIGIPFIETSAKHNTNVSKAFSIIIHEILNTLAPHREQANESIVNFLSEIEVLKQTINRDLQGKIAFYPGFKRAEYQALEMLAKSVNDNFPGGDAQDFNDFVENEILKIKAKPEFLEIGVGNFSFIKDFFLKYTDPDTQETKCSLM